MVRTFKTDMDGSMINIENVFDLPGGGAVYKFKVSTVHDSMVNDRGGVIFVFILTCISSNVSIIAVIREGSPLSGGENFVPESSKVIRDMVFGVVDEATAHPGIQVSLQDDYSIFVEYVHIVDDFSDSSFNCAFVVHPVLVFERGPVDGAIDEFAFTPVIFSPVDSSDVIVIFDNVL